MMNTVLLLLISVAVLSDWSRTPTVIIVASVYSLWLLLLFSTDTDTWDPDEYRARPLDAGPPGDD